MVGFVVVAGVGILGRVGVGFSAEEIAFWDWFGSIVELALWLDVCDRGMNLIGIRVLFAIVVGSGVQKGENVLRIIILSN
jgi:hypothetical protein